MLPIKRSPMFYCPSCVFMTLTTPMEKSHALRVVLQPQNQWAMVSRHSTQHMWHLSFDICNWMHSPGVDCKSLFQIDQMKAPSLLLWVQSHTFPHFKVRLIVRMLCHLVNIDPGNGFATCYRFLPMAYFVAWEVIPWFSFETCGVKAYHVFFS